MENTHYWISNRWDKVFPHFLYAKFLPSESHFFISHHLLGPMVAKIVLTELDRFPSLCLYRLTFQIFTFWHLA